MLNVETKLETLKSFSYIIQTLFRFEITYTYLLSCNSHLLQLHPTQNISNEILLEDIINEFITHKY